MRHISKKMSNNPRQTIKDFPTYMYVFDYNSNVDIFLFFSECFTLYFKNIVRSYVAFMTHSYAQNADSSFFLRKRQSQAVFKCRTLTFEYFMLNLLHTIIACYLWRYGRQNRNNVQRDNIVAPLFVAPNLTPEALKSEFRSSLAMSSFICPAVAAISPDSSDSIGASSLCLGVVGIQITSNTNL